MLPAAATARLASAASPRPPCASARPVPHQPARPSCQNRVAMGTRLAPAQDPQEPLPRLEPPRHRPSVARQREEAFLTETGNRQPELRVGGGKWLGWGCPREHGRLPQPQQHPKTGERTSSRFSPAQPKLPSTPEQCQRGQHSALGPPAWLEDGAGCPPAGTVPLISSLQSPPRSLGPAEHPG